MLPGAFIFNRESFVSLLYLIFYCSNTNSYIWREHKATFLVEVSEEPFSPVRSWQRTNDVSIVTVNDVTVSVTAGTVKGWDYDNGYTSGNDYCSSMVMSAFLCAQFLHSVKINEFKQIFNENNASRNQISFSGFSNPWLCRQTWLKKNPLRL